jgi:hypothetical protein
LQLLQDALEGSGGGGPPAAYVEAIRLIFKVVSDKSPVVRAAVAGCLRAVAITGGPGLGSGGLEACINLCLKVQYTVGRLYPACFIRFYEGCLRESLSLPQKNAVTQFLVWLCLTGPGRHCSTCSGWLCCCFRKSPCPGIESTSPGIFFPQIEFNVCTSWFHQLHSLRSCMWM